MKRFLLLSFVAGAALCASAGVWNNYFTVEYDGQKILPGYNVVCNNFKAIEDVDIMTGDVIELDEGDFTNAPIHVYNHGSEPIVLRCEVHAAPVSENNPQLGKNPTVCFEGAGENGKKTGCTSPTDPTATIPDCTYNTFEWQLHKYNSEKVYTCWVFSFWPEEDPEAVFYVNVHYGTNFAGGEDVVIDNTGLTDEGPQTAVASVAEDTFAVAQNGNVIVLTGAKGETEVYSVDGKLLYKGDDSVIPVVAKGLVIVRNGGNAKSILLK